MKLKISNELLNHIHDHAMETYPDECCGFFYGTDNGERIIFETKKVINSKKGDKRRRFEISPQDYFKAEKYAEKQGVTLLGVYHSHPDHPARPSQYDLKQAVPFFSYIIVSVKEGEIADTTSWQLNQKNEFEEEKIIKTE